MSTLLRQSTAFTFRIGPFKDEDDGKTAETGLSIAQADIQISKDGGAFAQTSATSPTTTHDTDGWYQCPLTASDTDTLGPLTVQIVMAGALDVWKDFVVVPANVYDSLVDGSDDLDVQVSGLDADVITAAAIADDAFAAEHFATGAFTSDVAAASFLDAIRDNLHAIMFTRMMTQIDPSTGLFRIGWRVTDLFGNLPSTAEITPGTVSIARKVPGTGTYIGVTTDSALSEAAGQIYLQRSYDPDTDGFGEGDTVRLHWKSISVTIDGVTFELCDSSGTFTYDQVYNTSADVLANTSVDVVTTQTSMTLDAGPAEDDVLNGHYAIFTDNVDGSRKGTAVVSDWTGSTLTLTLEAGAQFTIASGDRCQVVANPETSANVVSLDTAAINSIRDAITGGAYALDTDTNGRVRVVSGTGAGEIDLDTGAVTVDALTTAGETAIQDEVQDAIEANHLDHLLAVDTGATLPGVSGSVLQDLLEDDGGTWRFTVNALEQAPSGGGGGSTDWTSDEREEIRYRLGIDGTVSTPATNDPNLGTVDANVTQLDGDAQSLTDLKDFADAGYDPATNKIQGVVLVDTTTVNSDMRGTDGANTTTPPTANAVADQVLEELIADHSGTAGSLAERLSRIPNINAGGSGGLPTVDASNHVAGIQGTKNTLDDLTDVAANAVRDAILSDSTPFPGAAITEARLSELDEATSGKMANQVDLVKTDTAAILLDTDEMQQDLEDGGRIDALIDSILTRLPSSLVSGRIDANIGAINDNASAAAKLASSADTQLEGAAIAGTLSTTQMSTDITETRTDQYNGRVIIWKTGNLTRLATEITDYDGAGVFTFVATNGAPAIGDTFIIV